MIKKLLYISDFYFWYIDSIKMHVRLQAKGRKEEKVKIGEEEEL